MNNKIVVDTSAIIALMNREKGFEIVENCIGHTVISSVIFSEVITVANRDIFSTPKEKQEGLDLIKTTFPNIIDFDSKQAEIAAAFDSHTKKYGLSLGDRVCLSLAKQLNLPVLTADKIWKKLDLGVKIELIR